MSVSRMRRPGVPVATACLVLLGPIFAVQAQQCEPDGLDETIAADAINGIDWVVHYNDDPASDDFFSLTDAQMIPPELAFAAQRHNTDWSFDVPWISTLPDWDVQVYDYGGNGRYTGDCILIGVPNLLGKAQSSFRWVTNHEVFHGVQRRYRENAGADSGLGFNSWVGEGSARCLDDRYDLDLDADGVFRVDLTRLMTTSNGDGVPYRDLSLSDLSYRGALVLELLLRAVW